MAADLDLSGQIGLGEVSRSTKTSHLVAGGIRRLGHKANVNNTCLDVKLNCHYDYKTRLVELLLDVKLAISVNG